MRSAKFEIINQETGKRIEKRANRPVGAKNLSPNNQCPEKLQGHEASCPWKSGESKMNKTKTCCIILTLIILLFAGCRHTPQHLTQNFGASYKAAFSRQVLNPDGPEDHGPVDSLSGDVANQIYKKRYIKSLTEEKDEEESVNKKLGTL